MNEFDTVVIGGGIAGCCAAIALARRGARTALLEAGAFPRHKVCGEFLSPDIRPVFRRLGLEELLIKAGAREVFQARLVAPDGRILELKLPSPALAISRFAMDAVLWNAAREAGANCFENTRVRSTSRNGAFHVCSSNGEYSATGIISAGGRHEKKKSEKAQPEDRRYFGLKTHLRGAKLEEGVTELHAFAGGYCGLVRVENGATNACLIARYDLWKRSGARSPDELFQFVLRQCPTLARRVADAEMAMPWLATGNLSFGNVRPAHNGILRCGDAAGFIPPFSGDGMAMAARAGELAGVTLGARLTHGDADTIYAAAWRREFESRLRWANALQPFFMEPLLSRSALTLASRVPPVARFLLGKTRG